MTHSADFIGLVWGVKLWGYGEFTTNSVTITKIINARAFVGLATDVNSVATTSMFPIARDANKSTLTNETFYADSNTGVFSYLLFCW